MESDTEQMDLSDFCKRGALEKRPLVCLLAESLYLHGFWPVYIESEALFGVTARRRLASAIYGECVCLNY